MSYATLRTKKTQLIRKARDGSVFIGPITATAITALTTGAGADLATLPGSGANVYQDLGWTTTDGVTFGRSTDISQVNSFGSVEPTRSDVTKDTITMSVTAQETKMLTMGLYTGADTSSVQGAVSTGEVQIAKPARPSFRYYRVLGLFVDTDDSGLEIYLARFMPRARITELAEQKMTDGDQAVEYQMTFTGYEDSTLGYSHKWIWAGPGWKALLADMSITQAT
jgi:hypothetical protein